MTACCPGRQPSLLQGWIGCDESCGVRRSYCRTRYRGGLLMRSVTYSMAVSLNGYVVGPDGSFD